MFKFISSAAICFLLLQYYLVEDNLFQVASLLDQSQEKLDALAAKVESLCPKSEKLPRQVEILKRKECPTNIGDYSNCIKFEAPKAGCYCFVEVAMNWADASAVCRDNGMELVSFETDEELENLEYLTRNVVKSGDWWTSEEEMIALTYHTYFRWKNDRHRYKHALETHSWNFEVRHKSDELFAICEK